jgi:hypothetical protein
MNIMIKQKQFIPVAICLLLLFFSKAKAQVVDKKIFNEYSPAVVIRVYEVASKTNIEISKQKKLATAFEEQDDILFSLIKQNKPVKEIDSMRQVLQIQWLNILSAKQQYYYSSALKKEGYQFKYFFSLFSLAIQNKDSLKLTEVQADSLFFKIDTLKKMQDTFLKQNPGKWFDSKAFQSEHMNRLLTIEQFNKLLVIKNTSKAYSFAEKDWSEIEQRGLAKNYIKDSAIKELTNYYIAKQSAFDQYAHDKLKQSSLVKYITDNKPKVLNALMHLRRNPANNTLGENLNW